jgi:hypothetical protein
MLEAEAAVTVALVAPKYTMLLVVVTLKPVPVSVTDAPGMADAGLKDVITGAWAFSPPAKPIAYREKKRHRIMTWLFFVDIVKSIYTEFN